jgi:hypothetical protein
VAFGSFTPALERMRFSQLSRDLLVVPASLVPAMGVELSEVLFGMLVCMKTRDATALRARSC